MQDSEANIFQDAHPTPSDPTNPNPTEDESIQNAPAVPESPSIHVARDPAPSPDPSQLNPAPVVPVQQAPEEFVRQKNLEESHNWIANLFFCFYCPLVCRCSPVTDKDIYECHSLDRASRNIGRAEKLWEQPAHDYITKRKAFEEEKERDPNTKTKPPKEPGLFGLTSFKVTKSRISIFYFFQVINYVFLFLQPAMMKQVLKTIDARELNPSTPFPYASGIILILCPFLANFFDALASRFSFHHVMSVRSMLAGLIYRKTLMLNITAQSNIDSGRLLSLISTDCRNVAENLWMFYLMSMFPLQVLVPLGFVLFDFGWCGLISLGVIAIVIPITVAIMLVVGQHIHFFLAHNDERNKIMNETLQGMRIVKFTGLEHIFLHKLGVPRKKQIREIGLFMWYEELSNAIVRNLPVAVNASTLSVFVVTRKIPPSKFASEVMPNVGFLTMMTREANAVPMYLQMLMMTRISLKRIKQFLLLPELQQEEYDQPVEEDIALQIENGNYNWAEPPEIPLTTAEMEILKRERHIAKKNAAKRRAMEKQEEMGIVSDQTQQDPNRPGTTSPTQNDQPIFQDPQENRTLSPVVSVAQSNPVNEHETPCQTPSPFGVSTPTPSPTDSQTTLSNINIKLKKGSLTMVVGGVGSGKSSIGAAIIGDIERVTGNVRMKGSIAYCPQVPWINNNTVRGNIIFGSPFDEQKYLNTVRVCALEPDFKTLSAGDQTAIGEKGVNLSGGQKARIQLARSIYSDRDIYVLDDPLSAVDAHVGRYLMDECICKQLKGKTVMLMTNQLQFLNRADHIVLLNHGKIVAQGSYAELGQDGINFDEYLIKANENTKKKEDEKKVAVATKAVTLEDLAKGADSEAGKQIITEEEMETGSVSFSNYFRFLGTLFPLGLLILFFVLIIICEAFPLLQAMWLGIVPNENMFSGVGYYWKIGVYGLSIVISFLLMVIRAGMVACASVRSSTRIHNELVQNVVKCPTSFFDTTPMGRILNRFTGDLFQTDAMLLSLFMQNVAMIIGVIGQIVIVSIQSPFFLCIGIPALIAYYVIAVLYKRTARNVQRLDSIARSPVISLFSEIISGAGLSTIRAFGLEEVWRQRYYKALDNWTVRTVLFMEGKAWATLYTGFATLVFMAGVVLLGWFTMTPAQLSVSINSAITFAFLGFYLVMELVELEARMTNYERIRFYSTKLPKETTKYEITPSETWPEHGNVQFEGVSFRYRHGLPYVLQDVDFTFRGGEKIGVCGRTGAGKSSLIFALFRLVELDPKLEPKMIDIQTGFPIDTDPNEEPNKGRVLIDGVDISKIELGKLRRSIAIIPQDPTLFTGTVRHNLDLASKCSDDRIWEVLDMIEMREVVSHLPAGLDTPVAEGGSNFSTGQRQLLCFVRAILNNCRIVVLDEATASVDVETDAKIQKTIREQFRDKTVIVIAHRLNTIMDSDKIMVMDKGRVAEFDSPANLKANPDSAFNGLIRSLDH
ncbi:Multidrug resistance-associated protein [Blattamonas nauphoetae]|uniref:Multidrug resistance-associated protein n=1 Tax=Blattamonas nauphoetae TaxID=2049346 RepID=A0ABQ9XSE5_9EUKA|nr:Multidrug resistance-associated protein [Blattamonas nauphoetae]